MSINEKTPDPKPLAEGLEELADDGLEAVAGGARAAAVNPYAGYPSNLSEGLAPSVVTMVESIARECMSQGDDRYECGEYIKNYRLDELRIMNEAEGFDYMIDFYYLNMVLDRVYGTTT